MDIFSLIGGIFKPAADLIDNLHTSDEEKLKLKAKMQRMEYEVSLKVLNYEKELMKERASVIKAEATGKSWLQRNWRPITMMVFLALIVGDSFGWTAFRLPEGAWTVFQLALGGYVVGRSVEKITPVVANRMAKK